LLKDKIVKPKSNLDELKEQEEILEARGSDLRKKEEQIKIKLNQLKSNIVFETKQLTQLQNTKDKCPTCKRDYSEEHVDHVSKSIEEHNNKIAKFTEEESQCIDVLNKIEHKFKNIKEQLDIILSKKLAVKEDIGNNKTYQVSIDHLQTNLKEINEDIFIVNTEQNNELKGKISTLKDFVENSKMEVDKLNNELNVLETVKFVISEEGIKSFIVKKILTVLNSRIAYYLKKLEANCLCKFNEFFDEEIIDENAQDKSYFNFSGGERKRIDLACLFAFADIRRLQGDVNFNTVFYDELLDSSLDDKGVSLTLKVLRERFTETNESCYIITHRGPEVTTKAEHTIHVIKRNGISAVSC